MLLDLAVGVVRVQPLMKMVALLLELARGKEPDLPKLVALEVNLLAVVVAVAVGKAQHKDLDPQLVGLGLGVEQELPAVEVDPQLVSVKIRIFALAW